jgi:hypothetical protein
MEAAAQFWREPPNEVAGGALAAIVSARRMRPQAARALVAEQKARALAQVLDPGETVAAALIVALHLASRRPLLGAFLDQLGIAHTDGVLKDEAAGQAPPSEEQVRRAVPELLKHFGAHDVATYLNALWLQDPEHWGALAVCADSLATAEAGSTRGQAGS